MSNFSSSSLSVRRTARLMATMLATLVALVALAIPAKAQDRDCPTLTGAWNGNVVTTIPSSGETTLTFLRDGTLGAPDNGTWEMTRGTKFTFTLRYERYNEAGELIGHTEGAQNGVISADGKSFASTGTSTVYNLDGSIVLSFGVIIRAERTEG